MNVSNTPWSSFSQADFDDDPWQRAANLDHETGNTPRERYDLLVHWVGVSRPGEWTADVFVDDRP